MAFLPFDGGSGRRRPTGPGRNGHVIEPELEGVLQIDRPTKPHPTISTEVTMTSERHVHRREEVFVPTNRDAIFAHSAKPEQNAFVEFRVELLEVSYGTRRNVE